MLWILSCRTSPLSTPGVNSAFRILRPLYVEADRTKIATIEKLVMTVVKNLEEHAKFNVDAEVEEYPTSLVWAYYFTAQHFDAVGNFASAMTMIDKAIEHTPTLVELYLVKGKIYKHCGNYVDAAHWLSYARELDTADRFINSKCTKYMLRAGQVEEGEKTASFFTKVKWSSWTRSFLSNLFLPVLFFTLKID